VAGLRVVNPIPLALAHYERELRDVLSACSVEAETVGSPSIERSSDGPSAVRRAGSVLRWRMRPTSVPRETLALFPAFGLADPISWLRRRGKVWLVVHDPAPVARQLGTGRPAAALGRLVVGRKVRVVVHSQPAADLLRRRGWSVEMLPHPVRERDDSASVTIRREPGPVTVLGQWKPARTLEPLHQFSAAPDWHGRRQIVGRGWPNLPGWSVDSRFVGEGELDERIAAASCVLLPYDRYFQSGIAMRCLEAGVPVVGRRHPFLEDLFGANWPGLVEGDDWLAAAGRANAVPRYRVLTLRTDYWQRCVAAWESSSLVSSLRG
jgi:hypothetical protein